MVQLRKGEGGGAGVFEPTPPIISKTVGSTKFNFGRPLGLSLKGRKKMLELMT